MIQALIFDFDGLILDTEVSALQSWQEIYQSYGVPLPLSLWSARIGGSSERFDPCGYLEEQLGRPVPREAILAERRRRRAAMVATLPTLPGVEAYITAARRLDLKLGLASSSTYGWVSDHLRRLGIHAHFDCIRCANDVTRTKPDPELYLSVLACLRVAPKQALALEDSPNGVLAAQRAGIFCVAVPNSVTSQLPLEHADLRLTTLNDVPLEELLVMVREKRAMGHKQADGYSSD